jgi:hypothetical protein
MVTPEDELFDCVSMPRIRIPSTEDTPPREITGNLNITPLLSVRRSETGFWTWLLRETVVPVHAESLHE